MKHESGNWLVSTQHNCLLEFLHFFSIFILKIRFWIMYLLFTGVILLLVLHMYLWIEFIDGCLILLTIFYYYGYSVTHSTIQLNDDVPACKYFWRWVVDNNVLCLFKILTKNVQIFNRRIFQSATNNAQNNFSFNFELFSKWYTYNWHPYTEKR